MMTPSRSQREEGAGFPNRRGHSSQLSISDPTQHVTETIGTLYGEEDDVGLDSGRPLSFASGDFHAAPSIGLGHGNSFQDSSPTPTSPTFSLREVQADSSGQQFPLTNIDNPSDIAQELSNLQALRRLSMDVGNTVDPDMPPMSLSAMPSVAPNGGDDENDPSRLLWVPARVHPELAPTEFKTFLESRLQSIRRRSGDSFLAIGGGVPKELGVIQPSSLRRKKSMLSHQVHNAEKGMLGSDDSNLRSEEHQINGRQSQELSLDELAKNPTNVVQKFTQETQGFTNGTDTTVDDMPILPIAPGAGLRRSTRTTYRKGGSLRSGDKVSFSKRIAQRQRSYDLDNMNLRAPESPHGHSLTRIQSEPITENYSRPSNLMHRQHYGQNSPGLASVVDAPTADPDDSTSTTSMFHQDQPSRRTADWDVASAADISGSSNPSSELAANLSHFPQRTSSQLLEGTYESQFEENEESSIRPHDGSASRNTIKPSLTQQQYSARSASLSSRTSNTSVGSTQMQLASGSASRTDTLTFIPTLLQDERKLDKKTKKDRDDESHGFHKSGSAWKWFKGSADEKERKKDDGKKSKSRVLSDKAQDNVRLDVIQSSLDTGGVKSRESLVLDRDSMDNRLQEERKKESNRRGESKKDKDSSIFSSFFGGKKKEEKEKGKKNLHLLPVPDDPRPYKPLQPDVDYSWTRFPLLEERAIYRMAHIKLANPRRSLHSQVLLSNFMYSYLAIVQAMHPQMNVPISPQQKRLEEEARSKQEQQYLAQQQTREEQDIQPSHEHYNFEYHRLAGHYSDAGVEAGVEYADDSLMYENDHISDERPQYNSEPRTSGEDINSDLQYHPSKPNQTPNGQTGSW